MPSQNAQLKPPWQGAALLLASFLLLQTSWTMGRNINHDEHQFLAPAIFMAREGLLPYRDFPLFHLPNLPLVYACLDRITGAPLLASKAFSVLCSFTCALVLVLLCRKYPPANTQKWALPAAVLALGFLFFDPLFSYGSGKLWNHEFPTALSIAATAFVISGSETHRKSSALIAGILAGTATGSRLTFAPLLLPLCLAHLLFLNASFRSRTLLAASFSAGAFIGLLPTLYCFWAAPEAFLFNNFEFPRLGLLDPANERIHKTTVWWRKLRYFAKEVVLPSWPLFTATLLLLPGRTAAWFRHRRPQDFPAALVAILFPFLLLGCFAPSRYQYQHSFVLIPFLILGAVLGASHDPIRKAKKWALFLLLGASITLPWISQQNRKSGFDLRWLSETFSPSHWRPLRIQASVAKVQTLAGSGPVLSLAPIPLIAAGIQTYPEFATGPFALRSASLVNPIRRAKFHMPAPEDLERLLSERPPAAIVTGEEPPSLEKPLFTYAKTHHFRPVSLNKNRTLWLPNPPTPAPESP
jgi:hypothetical protein